MKPFSQLSFLLFFLFGGAIIGETVSLSMVVSVLGPSIVGKLYLINGALLLLLPPLFFQNIDKVNRGKLLSCLLAVVAVMLLVFLTFVFFSGENRLGADAMNRIILVLYPLSYLSKTILFLTFWTLANDLSSADDSKKGFPRVAAWGFMGGLAGACVARLLLVKMDAIMIVGVWSAAYVMGSLLALKMTGSFHEQLLHKEDTIRENSGWNILQMAQSVLDSNLIKAIAALYFFVFIAVFLQDYLFWKKSSQLFATPNGLASFQFTFYLVHSVVTTVGLRFIMPSLIHKWGILRSIPLLPITLFCGSVILLMMTAATENPTVLFTTLIAVQFARYVVFENAFSPVYQMFFAAIPKEKRGRSKTFLEGVIKPCAIIFSGAIIPAADAFGCGMLFIIALASAAMIVLVVRLRVYYREALAPRDVPADSFNDIMTHIGNQKDQKLVALVGRYSRSKDIDMRSLSVKILARDGSRRAFDIIVDIFNAEQNESVKEAVARSLSCFSSPAIKPLLERLVDDANPRIRANALFSLNEMKTPWILNFKERASVMLFENNPRIQIEAARFLWTHGDKEDQENIFSVLDSLCASKNLNRLSAGLYLIGCLKPPKWELMLLNYLRNAPLKAFAKCVEIIMESATKETRLRTLTIIEGLSRKHIALAGKIMRATGIRAFDAAGEFLRTAGNERMIVEVIHALREVACPGKTDGAVWGVDRQTKAILSEYLMRDLEHAYRDGYIWHHIRHKTRQVRWTAASAVMEDALQDQQLRLCERILDVLVLIDSEGMGVAIGRDFDLKDRAQRLQVAEIVESLRSTPLIALSLPVLRGEGWEEIAKIGRNHFNFDYEEAGAAIYYFIDSKNKWVCFCSLYFLSFGEIDEALIAKRHAVLMAFKDDPNIYLSKAAAHFLSGRAHRETAMIEPFELLERVMALKETILFRHVSAEKLMGLAELFQCTTYKGGTLISREGEISDHLYIIRKGSLKIVKTKSGVKTLLTVLQAGETYGEIGLFNQAPRSASAIAHEDCELWAIQRSALKKYLLDMPEIAYNFLEVFSEKLRKSSEEVVELHASISKAKKDYL
jgi:hypothetical protein